MRDEGKSKGKGGNMVVTVYVNTLRLFKWILPILVAIFQSGGPTKRWALAAIMATNPS